jgi:hypothetical protein
VHDRVVFFATGIRIRNILLFHGKINKKALTVPTGCVLWHNESARWFPSRRSFPKCESDRFLRYSGSGGVSQQFHTKHPDKGYNLDEVISELISYNRRQKDVSEAFAFTVNAILQISGKSYPTLFRTISLLKLVSKIQDVIVSSLSSLNRASGTLPVSQGYLFAANLGSPDFFTIFDEIMETPVTNVKLEKMLTAYKKAKPKSTSKPMPIKKKVAVLQNAKSYFEKKTGMYAKSDVQTFLDKMPEMKH